MAEPVGIKSLLTYKRKRLSIQLAISHRPENIQSPSKDDKGLPSLKTSEKDRTCVSQILNEDEKVISQEISSCSTSLDSQDSAKASREQSTRTKERDDSLVPNSLQSEMESRRLPSQKQLLATSPHDTISPNVHASYHQTELYSRSIPDTIEMVSSKYPPTSFNNDQNNFIPFPDDINIRKSPSDAPSHPLSCETTSRKQPPLITFSRRAKRRNKLKEGSIQNNSIVNDADPSRTFLTGINCSFSERTSREKSNPTVLVRGGHDTVSERPLRQLQIAVLEGHPDFKASHSGECFKSNDVCQDGEQSKTRGKDISDTSPESMVQHSSKPFLSSPCPVILKQLSTKGDLRTCNSLETENVCSCALTYSSQSSFKQSNSSLGNFVSILLNPKHNSSKALQSQFQMHQDVTVPKGREFDIPCKQSIGVPCHNHEDLVNSFITPSLATQEKESLEKIDGDGKRIFSVHQIEKSRNICLSTEDVTVIKNTYDGKFSTISSEIATTSDSCQQNLIRNNMDGVLNTGRIFQSSRSDNTHSKHLSNTSSYASPFLALSLPVEHKMESDSTKSIPISSHLLNLHGGSGDATTNNFPETSVTSQWDSSQNFRAFSNVWAEEELDYLWMGIRRYGRGNWDAMLHDPKLHFSEWKSALDLAERWDQEQAKLLHGTLIYPNKSSNTGIFPCHSSGSLVKTMNWTPYEQIMEPKLSLGNVDSREQGSCLPLSLGKRSSPILNSLNYSKSGIDFPYQHKTGVKQNKPENNPGNQFYSYGKRTKYPANAFFDPSLINPYVKMNLSGDRDASKISTVGVSSKNELPHWLREVVNVTPRLTEPAFNKCASISRSSSLFYDEKTINSPFLNPVIPFSPSSAPHQRTEKSFRYTSNRDSDAQSLITPPPIVPQTNFLWNGTRLSHLPSIASSTSGSSRNQSSYQNNGESMSQFISSDYMKPEKNLIVIDSEASSEETISDDQSSW